MRRRAGPQSAAGFAGGEEVQPVLLQVAEAAGDDARLSIDFEMGALVGREFVVGLQVGRTPCHFAVMEPADGGPVVCAEAERPCGQQGGVEAREAPPFFAGAG